MQPALTLLKSPTLRALLAASALSCALTLPGPAQAQADPDHTTDLANQLIPQFRDIGRDLVSKERQHPTPGGPRTPGTDPLPGSPVSAPDLYNFTYYVWRLLNFSLDNAVAEYPEQLARVRPYLTPDCQARLSSEMWQRPGVPLFGFKRRLSLAPGMYPLWVGQVDGIGVFPNYITPRQAPDVGWDVQLNVIVDDLPLGSPNNLNRWMSVSIHVVPYDADPEHNPWLLAVDCPSGPSVDIAQYPDLVKQAQQRWDYLRKQGKVPFKIRLYPFWD